MWSPAEGAPRLVRATVLALVCAGLAVAGHGLGRAHVPSASLVLIVTALSAAVLAVKADRRRGPAEILLAMAGAQLAFHAAFSLEPSHGISPGKAVSTGAANGTSVVGSVGAMLLFHLVAAVLAALFLAYGEGLLWRLAAHASRFVRPRRRSAAMLPVRRLPSPLHSVDLPHRIGVRLAHQSQRRGPPAGATA